MREMGITKFLKEVQLTLEKENISVLKEKSNGQTFFKGIAKKDLEDEINFLV